MKTLKFLILLVIVVLLPNCSYLHNDVIEETKEVSIESSISNETFQEILSEINLKFTKTRSDGSFDLGDEEASQILDPLILDGKNIQDIIIKTVSIEESDISEEDLLNLMNLTEPELATLSFIVYQLNSNNIETRAVDTDRVLSCLGVAVGISSIKNLSLSGLVTAKTAMQVAKAVGKRYLGYIGVAIMIYDFADCIG